MNDVIFEVGDVVVATCNYAHSIKEGKEYIVTKYEYPEVTPTFTWPAYVTVIGAFGTPVSGHTYRFKKKTK
jgi:hypothetical protein